MILKYCACQIQSIQFISDFNFNEISVSEINRCAGFPSEWADTKKISPRRKSWRWWKRQITAPHTYSPWDLQHTLSLSLSLTHTHTHTHTHNTHTHTSIAAPDGILRHALFQKSISTSSTAGENIKLKTNRKCSVLSGEPTETLLLQTTGKQTPSVSLYSINVNTSETPEKLNVRPNIN